jgi:hypothetical protein
MNRSVEAQDFGMAKAGRNLLFSPVDMDKKYGALDTITSRLSNVVKNWNEGW